ncbi:MAG: hypothetical protein WD046_03690 [Paracoccaceae bacterium]
MGIEIVYAIIVAFCVLIASWWSATSAFRYGGRLRRAQLAALVLALLAMLMLSQDQVLASQIIGGLLVVAAAMALAWEKWQNKLFPLIHILFGLALILRLPFNGWANAFG